MAFWKISLPALSVMFPLPPEAVTAASRVRSSVAWFPAAVKTISPPPVARTVWFTVNGPLAVIETLPPEAFTPTTSATVEIVKLPVFARAIPPEDVVSAATTVTSVSIASPAPMPVTAVRRSWPSFPPMTRSFPTVLLSEMLSVEISCSSESSGRISEPLSVILPPRTVML